MVEGLAGTYLLTGGSVGAAASWAAAFPEAVCVGSVGPEMEPLAELRLLKTLLARRTNLERPFRSSS